MSHKLDENSQVISDMKIEYDNKAEERSSSGRTVITSASSFPSEFTVTFNKFGVEFNSVFTRVSKDIKSYPIASSKIYVLDENTGEPVEHVIDDNDDTVSVIYSIFL